MGEAEEDEDAFLGAARVEPSSQSSSPPQLGSGVREGVGLVIGVSKPPGIDE